MGLEAVLLKLAGEMPLALLFGLFAVFLIRIFNTQQAKRDEENRQANIERDKTLQVMVETQQEAYAARNEALSNSIATQNDLMRKFWEGQQINNRDVLERLVRGVETMMTTLQHHDRKTDVAIAAMFVRTGEEPPESLDVPTKPRRGGDD